MIRNLFLSLSAISLINLVSCSSGDQSSLAGDERDAFEALFGTYVPAENFTIKDEQEFGLSISILKQVREPEIQVADASKYNFHGSILNLFDTGGVEELNGNGKVVSKSGKSYWTNIIALNQTYTVAGDPNVTVKAFMDGKSLKIQKFVKVDEVKVTSETSFELIEDRKLKVTMSFLDLTPEIAAVVIKKYPEDKADIESSLKQPVVSKMFKRVDSLPSELDPTKY